jgi:alpha-N-acetylglucosamine transferase
MNLSKFLDNNFLLMKESDQLFSPLSMLHYQFYANTADLEQYLETHKNQIQCVVGQQYLPFGQAQCPSLMDYADGIDTMQFLAEL